VFLIVKSSTFPYQEWQHCWW